MIKNTILSPWMSNPVGGKHFLTAHILGHHFTHSTVLCIFLFTFIVFIAPEIRTGPNRSGVAIEEGRAAGKSPH
jgi:hypothetical protein